jgi:hypoxanthine phosphoribosyltransferase
MDMHRQNVQPLISPDDISRKVEELGRQITADYSGKDLLLVGLLTGVFPFFADLARAIDLDIQVCFMKVSSYGVALASSGEVKIVHDIDTPIMGKNVLIVDDIIDSGQTLSGVIKHLMGHGPASIRVCALLDKPARRAVEAAADYVGFTIDDHFVVGYGMDARGQYRNLPYIGVYGG